MPPEILIKKPLLSSQHVRHPQINPFFSIQLITRILNHQMSSQSSETSLVKPAEKARKRHRRPFQYRPRVWMCALAPWLLLILICAISAKPSSVFVVWWRGLYRHVLGLLRRSKVYLSKADMHWWGPLWRSLREDVPLWIHDVGVPMVADLRRSLLYSISVMLSLSIAIIRKLFALSYWILATLGGVSARNQGWASLCFVVVLGVWALRRALRRTFKPKGQFHSLVSFLHAVFLQSPRKAWALLCIRVKVGSDIFRAETPHIKSSQNGANPFKYFGQEHRHRMYKSWLHEIRAQARPKLAALLIIALGLIWTISLVFSFNDRMSAEHNPWLWELLNGKYSSPSQVTVRSYQPRVRVHDV